MANIQKIREVPDSEDELLSSSPVDITTVAPDKLFTAVPLSHQDVQDAPLRDPYCHQDSAEPIANDADTNTDGLGDGHEKASLHVGSPQDADPSSSHKAPPATSVNTGSPDMHLSPCYMAPEAALTSSSASGATSAVFVTDTPQTYAEPGPRENVQPATQDIQSSSKPKVSVSDDNYQDAHSRQAICDTEHFKTVFKDRTRPTDKACNEHNDNVSCTVSIAQVPAPTNLCYARNAPVRTTSEQFYNQHPEMSSLIGAHAEAHTVRSTRSSSLPLEDDRANMIAAELLDTSKIPCSVCLNGIRFLAATYIFLD